MRGCGWVEEGEKDGRSQCGGSKMGLEWKEEIIEK